MGLRLIGIVPTSFVAFEIISIHGSNLLIGKPQKKAGTVLYNPRLPDPLHNRGMSAVCDIGRSQPPTPD